MADGVNGTGRVRSAHDRSKQGVESEPSGLRRDKASGPPRQQVLIYGMVQDRGIERMFKRHAGP